MKILHVTKKYPNAVGGDAIVVSNLEKQQKKNGHEVFILTTNCDDILNKPNVTKFGLKDNSQHLDTITWRRIFSLIGLYFRSKKIISQIKPDVVHSHSIDMGFVLSSACRKYNIPIINTFHGGIFSITDRDKKRSFIERYLIKKAKFKVITTPNKKDLKLAKGVYNNLVYIPNGVDLSKFKNIKHKINKTPKILFVGRIDRLKGLDYLIDSAKILQDKKIEFEIELVGDGKDMEMYKERVKEMNLNKKIKFLGRKSPEDTLKHYQTADIFVLPSLDESFGIVLIEAMACKKPVIGTKVGGIPYVINPNKDGLLVPPKNPQALADAIIKILKNPKLAKQMGEAGYKKVKENFTWSIQVDKTNKLLKELVK